MGSLSTAIITVPSPVLLPLAEACNRPGRAEDENTEAKIIRKFTVSLLQHCVCENVNMEDTFGYFQ